MNCVFDAYTHHLAYLNLQTKEWERPWYEEVRRMNNVTNSFTPSGLVPRIIQVLATIRGLEVVTESRAGTKEFYLQVYEEHLLKGFTLAGDFGTEVKRVTLVPSIVLVHNLSHAMFVEGIAENWVVEMAFQLRKR